MSITSSKISFGTQFKANIVANRAARHLNLGGTRYDSIGAEWLPSMVLGCHATTPFA